MAKETSLLFLFFLYDLRYVIMGREDELLEEEEASTTGACEGVGCSCFLLGLLTSAVPLEEEEAGAAGDGGGTGSSCLLLDHLSRVAPPSNAG